MVRPPVREINLDEYPLERLRRVDCFEKVEKIGVGGSSHIYNMKDTETGETVALKKMICAKEGILQIKHEINILRMLQHENIVQMKEIVFSPGPEMDEQGNPDGCQCSEGSLYMVLEYMEHDLWGLIKNKEVKFTPPYIKCYMRQLLTGLHYLHVNKVLHHDIKGTNILLDNEGNLKIADFGLARALPSDPNEALTNKVVTLRYRPPELLLGSCNYGPAVDIWSAGCVFVELLQRKEFLSGNDEVYTCGRPESNASE